MTEVTLILGMLFLLFSIVSLRFFYLLHQSKKEIKIERNWFDEEYANEEYIRYSQYFED